MEKPKDEEKSKYRFPQDFKWPLLPGDYVVKDPEAPVAICSLSSHMEVEAPYAIRGVCRTENIGIERVIVNLISNPNIRFLILCGREVKDHRVGACLKALKQYGVDPATKRIINASGPLPILWNLPLEAIERFRRQVEVVDLIGVIDASKVAEEVHRCIKRDPGAYPGPPFKVETEAKLTVEIHLDAVEIMPECGLKLNVEKWRVE